MSKQRKSDIIKNFDKATPIFAEWKPSKSFREIFDKSVVNILNSLKKKDRINILEVGCGHGTWFEVLNKLDFSKKIRYMGIDFSKKRIGIVKRFFKKSTNARFLTADFLEYDDDKKYDLISFIEVFQYLHKKDFPEFLKKAKSMLGKNGYIAIIDKEKYSTHSFKISLGKFLKKLPYYYRHVHYPSFNHLINLGKTSNFNSIKKIKINEFNALVLKK